MKNSAEFYNELLTNKKIFFKFMNERYPIIFNSNVFLRDIQYAIRTYFERKNVDLSYRDAEKLMEKFTEHLVNEGDLVRLNYNSWKVNFTV